MAEPASAIGLGHRTATEESPPLHWKRSRNGWLGLPDIHRVELYVEPWNEGSWKTAENCGYMREGLLRGWEEIGGVRKDMYMYSRLD